MSYAIRPGPGVPSLLGGLLPLPPLAVVTTDLIAPQLSSLTQQWGFFVGGTPLIPSDNVVGMDARAESVVADYPIERGSFESYEKVKRPADVRFRYSTGGSVGRRSAMISAAKAAKESMTICMAIAPDDTFESVTVQHWDYHRTAASGLGLVSIDVWGWEVQVSNTSSQSQSQSSSDPSSASANVSSVTPTTPSQAQGAGLINAWNDGNDHQPLPGLSTQTPFGILGSGGIV